MTSAVATVSSALDLPDGAVRALREAELELETDVDTLLSVADRVIQRLEGRLMTLFASDERRLTGRFRVHYVWSLPGLRTFLHVSAPVDGANPSYPSIAAKYPVANWFEREIMDYFGVAAAGHPNPTPVALHADWPEGMAALRKDFPHDSYVPRVPGDLHPFRPVTGEGVFQIPVGPVHAGIIEPGHFRFGVAGEPVLYLQLRLFYVHKGIEKRFERLGWRRGLFLAESISGDTAVGHALAYAHAVERLAAVTVPPRARSLRVVLLELERLDNHIADIGALATDVAFAIPASRAQALREGLVRLQDQLLGTRLLRGTVALGGVKQDLSAQGCEQLHAHLRAFERGIESLMSLLLDAGTFTDRVVGTGLLSAEAARDLGVVGIAARASGVDADFRRDHPHDAYADLRFEVPIERGGDVRARLMIRAREIQQSLSILHQVLEAMPDTPLAAELPAQLPAHASALGWVEAWRGPCTHWVATDEHGEIDRVKVTDPSFLNWPGLAHAAPGNIVPDFPVINKSFNLSYSGNDR